MATTNLGKVSVTPKGEYDPLITYERLDVISHNGSSYIVKQASTGVTPIEGEFYALIAEKGDGGSFVKKAYKTYAAMDADKVNIPTNSSVDVTNDPDESKNGAYIYDGVAFTRSQYDSKVVTDKIIADAAIAVQDAINNTAVEGGVLADTFVTATANGVNAVARTQRDKNRDTVSVNDFATPQDAVNHLKSKGGGELYFPFGDYPCQVIIDSPNIKLRGEKGTILRSGGTQCVVDVAVGAFDFELDGFDIRGQNLATEGKSNENNTVINTNSLHCIRIREKGARLRNFKTSAARYDGLYVDYRGDVDLEVENFYIGSTARNPLSWIAGSNARFKNGHFFLDNQYSSVQGVMVSGLYLVDFEPNSVADQYRDIVFEGVSFESANTTSGANLLILQDTNLGESNSLDVYLKDCKFLENNGVNTAIRLKADTPIKSFTGLNLDNVTFPNRAAVILSGTAITLRNSTWRNVRVGNSSPTFGITFGEGCSLEDIKTTSSAEGTVDIVAGKVRLSNVLDAPDTNIKESRVYGDLRITGNSHASGNSHTTGISGVGVSRVEAREINIGNITDFTDILTVSNRGSFKITIAGADATTGERSTHISESWIVVSDTYARQAPINIILNSETTGLDVKWKAGSGGLVDSRTLQVRAKDSASNHFVVKVETLGSHTGPDNATTVSWLI